MAFFPSLWLLYKICCLLFKPNLFLNSQVISGVLEFWEPGLICTKDNKISGGKCLISPEHQGFYKALQYLATKRLRPVSQPYPGISVGLGH